MTASIRGGIFTMAMLLKGAEVAKALTEELHAKTEELKKNGVEPCLAILRVGAREDDLAYERGALKRCEKVGVAVRQVVLPEDVTQKVLMENIHALGADEKVHGVLMFRPLPGHLDDEAARAALDPKKDMDGITDGSMTAVYAGTKGGYPPCTAAACVALLKHYNIPIKGKRVVVIGRSLVIGKPVSLLLLAEHATVTICHSRSENLPEICREADILVVAAGKAGMVGAESVRAGQVVLDVGIHVGADGNLCGDTRFAEVEPVVEAITPVPGGVGTVTSTILASHVVEAAERAATAKKQPQFAPSQRILRTASAARELDIRGMETLEAESVLDNYIDAAVMAHLETVTIIHGKGTGALRKAVHASLRRNKAVKSFRLGNYGEGESGVTVVELK